MTGSIDGDAEHALLSSIMAKMTTADGRVVGAAFAVSPDLAVTSAHVLAHADQLVPLVGAPTAFEIVASFADVDEVMPKLAPWPDVAVVRLTSDHRFAVWGELARSTPTLPATVRMVGFPPAGGARNLAIDEARITSVSGDAAAAVLRITDAQVEGGASGGPLIDPASRTIVGVVLASKDPRRLHGGYAASAGLLHDRWPTHATRPQPPPRPWDAAYPPPATTGSAMPISSRLKANDPHFVMRDGLIRQLHSAGDETTVIRALGGSGGVGKTELALWWARRCRDSGDHDVVWWVDATTEASTHAGLADLAHALGVEQGPDLASTAAAVDAALGRITGRWLVVFDNADVVEHLTGNLPTADRGMALVTTRSTTSSADLDAIEIDVDVFDEHEAVDFLISGVRSSLHGPAVSADALSVADRLGFLPLALAQAVAFMNQESMSVSSYDTLVAADLPRGLRVSARRHQRTVATLWDHIWPLLSSDALTLLARASLLAPRSIPIELLGSDSITTGDAVAALRLAARYRVVTINDSAGEIDTIDVHQLTQVAAAPSSAERISIVDDTIEWVNRIVADADVTHPSRWPVWERIDPHVAALYAKARPPGRALLVLVDRLANYRRFRGLNQDAIPLFEAVLKDSEELLGLDDDDTVTGRANLASAYWEAGRTTEAIALEEIVLADRERILGRDHPSTITARADLAASYWQAGRTAEAIAIEEVVLADRERILGRADRATIGARNNLALSYSDAGRFSEAIDLLLTVRSDYARVLGRDHPTTMTATGNLANCYHRAGQTEEAIALEEQVVRDTLRILGPDHPDHLLAQGNLATSYFQAGRMAEALELRSTVLDGRERLLGLDHPTTLVARVELSASYRMTGRTAEAVELNEAAVLDFDRLVGADHPHALVARANLAQAYLSNGRLPDALVTQEGVVADSARVLGSEHPDALHASSNLAALLWSVGRRAEALELLERTAADSERALGVDHTDTVTRSETVRRWRSTIGGV